MTMAGPETHVNASILAAHPFLHGLPGRHVARLAGHARTVAVPDRLWLIEAGQVALDVMIPGNGRVIIEFLSRGDVVGLSWLFPPFQWGFGAITTQPLQAFELDGPAIRAECGRDPAFGHDIAERFLRVTLHRLQTTRSRLLDVCAHPELLS